MSFRRWQGVLTFWAAFFSLSVTGTLARPRIKFDAGEIMRLVTRIDPSTCGCILLRPGVEPGCEVEIPHVQFLGIQCGDPEASKESASFCCRQRSFVKPFVTPGDIMELQAAARRLKLGDKVKAFVETGMVPPPASVQSQLQNLPRPVLDSVILATADAMSESTTTTSTSTSTSTTTTTSADIPTESIRSGSGLLLTIVTPAATTEPPVSEATLGEAEKAGKAPTEAEIPTSPTRLPTQRPGPGLEPHILNDPRQTINYYQSNSQLRHQPQPWLNSLIREAMAAERRDQPLQNVSAGRHQHTSEPPSFLGRFQVLLEDTGRALFKFLG